MLHRLRHITGILAVVVCSLMISNHALADAEVLSVTAWGMTCELPAGWTAASDDVKAGAKVGIAKEVSILCEYLTQSGKGTRSDQGIGAFDMAMLPEGRGSFVAYSMRIPQDRNYFNTAIGYMSSKVDDANNQGAGIKLNKNEIVWIGDSRFLKRDLSYGNGVRIVMMDCWFGDQPDEVGRVQFTLLPTATADDRQAMEGVISSLQADLPSSKNVTIGPVSLYVPSGWKALDSADIASAKIEMEPQVAGGFQTFAAAGSTASISDLKAFNRGGVNMIIVYTVSVTLPDQTNYLQALQNAQVGQVDQLRAKMTSAECRRGLINGVDVVRMALVDANGAKRTVVQQWDASNPGQVTIVSFNVASDAPAEAAGEAQRMIRSISRVQ